MLKYTYNMIEMLIKYFFKILPMARSKLKLCIYAVLLLVLLFSLINILVPLGGYPFILEFLGLLLLVVLSVIGFAGYSRHWGERAFFFVFLLYLGNLLLIWYFLEALYVVLLVIALIGFLLAVPRAGSVSSSRPQGSGKGRYPGHMEKVPVEKSAVPYSEVFEPENTKAEARLAEKKSEKSLEKSEKKVEKNVETTFTPGKFVASRQSNTYHFPRCDWAKKIYKARQVWFKSKEEAWEKGYRAHSCIEKP